MINRNSFNVKPELSFLQKLIIVCQFVWNREDGDLEEGGGGKGHFITAINGLLTIITFPRKTSKILQCI